MLYITCARAKNLHIPATLLPISPVIDNLDNGMPDSESMQMHTSLSCALARFFVMQLATKSRSPDRWEKEPIDSLPRNSRQARRVMPLPLYLIYVLRVISRPVTTAIPSHLAICDCLARPLLEHPDRFRQTQALSSTPPVLQRPELQCKKEKGNDNRGLFK